MNFLGQDSHDWQYPVTQRSKGMARQTIGPWKRSKMVTRYIVERKAVVEKYGWQDESTGVT